MLSRPRLSLASLTLLATLLLQVPASLAQDRVEPSSACLIDREIFSTRTITRRRRTRRWRRRERNTPIPCSKSRSCRLRSRHRSGIW